jgi:hypothetical protein
MSTTHLVSTRKRDRTASTIAVMAAGLLLTVAATVAPYVDRASGHVLADHIRQGYPAYTDDRVDAAVNAWIGVLTVVGVVGVVGWAGSMWAVATRRAWAPEAATSLFLVGTGLSLTALLTKDSSGDVGLVPLLGWIGMLPSVAGLVAVVMLWAARGEEQQT